MNTGIYSITSPSGSMYIGSAVNFGRRWGEHKTDLRKARHHSVALQNAWNKYGEQAMKFSKLLICSKDMLLAYEQILLDNLRPEYNICKVAGSALGRKLSPASIAKIAASNRGTPRSAANIAAVKAANTGRKKSQAELDLLRAANVGKKLSDEHKAKIGAANRGRRPSASCIDAIVAANTGRKQTPAHVEARVSSSRGSKWSEARRAKFAATWAAKRPLA